MVCSNHLKVKYVRFLIKYHVTLFCLITIMTVLSSIYLILKHHEYRPKQIFQGFQAHGTSSSNNYRKLIALLRETQTKDLFPHSSNRQISSEYPYRTFEPHRNPCSKRLHRAQCSVRSYVELTFRIDKNFNGSFDDYCLFENDFRSTWTNCSKTSFCCDFIGPVDRCEDFANSTAETFRVYIDLNNSTEKLVELYKTLSGPSKFRRFRFESIELPSNENDPIFKYVLDKNIHLIGCAALFYVFSLIYFVKNSFFILTIFLNVVLSLTLSSWIYLSLLKYPWTILNFSSLILYGFIVLIDSFLWFVCWTNNNHRRDDCTVHRIIENLLTQAFYYFLPKTLTLIIVLVITFTNQIIALQAFVVQTILLISVSFLVSFLLFPVCFIFLLHYRSSIPTLEPIFTKQTNSFLDRAIPLLVIRLKALCLTFFIVAFGASSFIIFHWPKLEFDVCQISFQTVKETTKYEPISHIDFDLTFYMGADWEVMKESLVPSNDILILQYNVEDRVNKKPNEIYPFSDALQNNLPKFFQFCSSYFDNRKSDLKVLGFPCFANPSKSPLNQTNLNKLKFGSIIDSHRNSNHNCRTLCWRANQTDSLQNCIMCLNSLFYQSFPGDDLFFLKNGLRFISEGENARYLLQTVNLRWTIHNDLHQYKQWKQLIETIEYSPINQFYLKTFNRVSVWWSAELFSTVSIMEQLNEEKHFRIPMKFLVVLIFLCLFTGILGIFVTLTTLFNFLTCLATLTLFGYKITIENVSYFLISLIISSQYSVLYSISYKLAPTFFFQRENRTMYSTKHLCSALFHVTLSIMIISGPCLFSSLPYLFHMSFIYMVSSSISLIYSTFFLQSLLCCFGPAGHSCSWITCRLTCSDRSTLNTGNLTSTDGSGRSTTSSTIRRHHRHLSHPRMSTSSHFASSYFSQIFTGSTYFESDLAGANDPITNSTRRRESSRSHQVSHLPKRNSLVVSDHMELYTPRTSLAPQPARYTRQSSFPRGVPPAALARPLYISSSISPFSQLSIQSQMGPGARSPSPHIYRPSRSPSPSPCSFMPPTMRNRHQTLRPCLSAPRLHPPMHRMQTTMPMSSVKRNDTLIEETTVRPVEKSRKKSMNVMQRQNAISSNEDDLEITQPSSNQTPMTAEIRRNILKATTIESGGPVWLKRSSSS